MEFNKLPPQNLEAEISVLGAVLLNNDKLREVRNIVNPDDFYRKAHHIIFETMLNMFDKEMPIDMITLVESVRAIDRLDDVGGPIFIATLADSMSTAANIEYYAKIVKEKAVAREVIQLGAKLVDQAYSGVEAIDLMDALRYGTSYISLDTNGIKMHKIKDVLRDTFDSIETMFNKSGESETNITGVPAGYSDIDSHTAGFQGGDLVIIAGRPAMGKSIMAIDIARNAGVPVAFFPLEMSIRQNVKRMLSGVGRINHTKTRTGRLGESDWPKMTRAAGELAELDIYMSDEGCLTLNRIVEACEKLKATKNIGAIIIDYLQLIRVKKEQGRNREQEVSEIAQNLKNLARRLDIPVICLAQLSRACEARPDKRPHLSDLRESGSLEQESDVVMFIYRPGYYFKDNKIKDLYKGWDNPPSTLDDFGECIIAKGRDIQTGTVFLKCEMQYQTFSDYSKYTG